MEAGSVKAAFQDLARSQGFYGRLLRQIEESEDPEAVYAELGEGCNDVVDLVMKVEG